MAISAESSDQKAICRVRVTLFVQALTQLEFQIAVRGLRTNLRRLRARTALPGQATTTA